MKTALAQEKAPQLRIVAGGNAPDPNEIRILVIDGHVLFVEGIRTLIRSESGMTIIGHAAHRTAALEAAAMKPHVILLELVLQDQGTLDFLPDLLRIAEGARVLVVTGETDSELQVRATLPSRSESRSSVSSYTRWQCGVRSCAIASEDFRISKSHRRRYSYQIVGDIVTPAFAGRSIATGAAR